LIELSSLQHPISRTQVLLQPSLYCTKLHHYKNQFRSTRRSCPARTSLPTTSTPCRPFQSTSTNPSHRAKLKVSLQRPPTQPSPPRPSAQTPPAQRPPPVDHHPPTQQQHPSQAQLPPRNQRQHAPPKAHKMPFRLLPSQAQCRSHQRRQAASHLHREQAKAALSPAP
jgi:hypothetical protein